MNVDYGLRIRAVADYLETVPGDKYDFYIGPFRAMERGPHCPRCVIAHAYDGGLIQAEDDGLYSHGKVWLFGSVVTFESTINGDAIGRGESAKQVAIAQLRTYADKHYPVASKSTKHVGLPATVREIFEGVTA